MNDIPATPGPLGWANVDDTAVPNDYVSYLRLLATSSQVAATKKRLNSLLNLKRGARVLDIGCGIGADVAIMSQLLDAQGLIVGLDNSMSMLQAAIPGKTSAVSLVQGSAYDLPFADGVFDAVRAERVLMHLDDPARAVRQMGRVVRPGGSVLLADPDSEVITIRGPDPALAERILKERRKLVRAPSAGTMHGLWLRSAGLSTVQFFPTIRLASGLAEIEPHTQIYASAALLGSRGLIRQSEVVSWQEELRDCDSRGDLLAVLCYFTTVGQSE